MTGGTLLTTALLLAQAAKGGKPDHPPRATLLPEAGDPMTGGATHLQEVGDLMTGGAPLGQEVTEEPLQKRIDRMTVETIRGVVAGAGAPGQGHR